MDIRRDSNGQNQKKWGNLLENLAIVIFVFYPLRHINWGLDLWDTGYNYANYQYMGTEHMDPMWLFSTYLTNVVGNLLTKLPRADTLMGMNLYTGLSASILALMGYFFCTRKLKMPKGIVFVGEMAALSLCWCPTATFYNYLTYVFFLISSVLLYLGLTTEQSSPMGKEHSMEQVSRKQRGYLIGAGAFLGANVLVRFSNLPQMAMILAVWVYDMICVYEEKANYKRKAAVKTKDRAGTAGENGNLPEGFWKRTIRHTLWCLVGYVGALAVLFGYIHIRYGFGEYLAGIARLFAMTDNATDYKPQAMIMGIIRWYWREMYWFVRIGIIVAGGMVMFAVAGWLENVLSDLLSKRTAAALEGGAVKEGKQPVIVRVLHIGVRALWIGVSLAMLVWLYRGRFLIFVYYTYDSIWHPGPIFLMLTMVIAMVRILDKNAPKEEKLISGMSILIILLTSIGSNNGVLPSLNNLFLAAPYALWECWRFLRYVGEKRLKCGLVLSSFPVKGILVSLLTISLVQFGIFGIKFAYAEGSGIQDPVMTVDNNAVLRNIKMNPQKVQWMTQLSNYVNENELKGKEVVLYGQIPSLSYYLQMPSAFNPWSDLTSYSYEAMEQDMAQLSGEISEKGKEKPVIILEKSYGLYEAQASELTQEKREKLDADPKWKLLLEFMEEFGYEQTFCNEKFVIYQ